MKESVLQFGPAKALVGILTEPAPGLAARPAVILFNAGLTHRVGPSRLYVKLARHLAAQGFTVLRFDLSGVGDSAPRADHLPFEKSSMADARAAMDCLQQTRGLATFVVMGHCSGAINSFLVAAEEPRVVAAVLINLEGGNAEWTAYDRDRKFSRYYSQYYRHIVADPQRWRRFFTGQVAYGKVLSNLLRGVIWNRLRTWLFGWRAQTAAAPAAAPPAVVEARANLQRIVDRGIRVLLVHSEGSTGLEYVRATLGETLAAQLAANRVQLEIIPHADHLFTLTRSQADLLAAIGRWVTA